MSLINRTFLAAWLAEAEPVAEVVLGLDDPSGASPSTDSEPVGVLSETERPTA